MRQMGETGEIAGAVPMCQLNGFGVHPKYKWKMPEIYKWQKDFSANGYLRGDPWWRIGEMRQRT